MMNIFLKKNAKAYFICFSVMFMASYLLAGNENNMLPDLPTKGLCFTENKGQVVDENNKEHSEVLFYTSSPSVTMYVTTKGITYSFHQLEGKEKEKQTIKLFRTDMNLLNASIKKENVTYEHIFDQGYENFILKDTEIKTVYSHEKVTVKNVYPGIDWVFISNKEKGLQYDFVVHPGADYKQIKIKIEGGQPLLDKEKKNISVKNKLGELNEGALYCFQNERQVESEFALANNQLSFNLGEYDKEKDLVIDPPLTWSTYYYGIGSVMVRVDKADNSIVVGNVWANNFPTQNAGTYYEGTYTGTMYAIGIVKFNATRQRIWATYYGLNSNTSSRGVDIDKNNNIYIVGICNSDGNFPIRNQAGAYNSAATSFSSSFISKFDAAGNYIWGTFYGTVGQSSYYNFEDIRIDENGTKYIVGSIMYHATPFVLNQPGAYNNSAFVATNSSGYILKLDNNDALKWSTLYESQHLISSVEFDKKGGFFIAGTSGSNSFSKPLAGAYNQSAIAGGIFADIFIAKFDAANTLVWATLFGGTATDGIASGFSSNSRGIAVDDFNNLYIAGNTVSTDLPVKNLPGAYNKSGFVGADTYDAFIAKFDATTCAQLWTTYFGGSTHLTNPMMSHGGYESACDIAVDKKGNLFVVGNTDATDFPLVDPGSSYFNNTFGSYLYDGNNSFGPKLGTFVAEFDNCGQLDWSSYYTAGIIWSVQFNSNFSFYTAGAIRYLPLATADPGGGAYYQANPSSGSYPSDDSFISEFSTTPLPFTVNFSQVATASCTNIKLDFTDISNLECIRTIAYEWSFGDGGTSTLQNPSHNYAAGGNYSVKLVTLSSYDGLRIDSITKTITVPALSSGITATPTINNNVVCAGGNSGNATVTISNGSGNYSYSWSTGTTSQTGTANTNTITLSNLIAGNYTITVADQSSSCISTTTFVITQPLPIALTASNNQIACWLNANTSLCNATAIATATNGSGAYSYNWSNGQTGATATNLCSVANVGYTVTVTDGNSCTATSTTLIAASSIYLNTSKTDITCNGGNDGSATAFPIAAAPYSLNWSTSEVTATIGGLSATTYTVTVTDANNCVITSTALITEPTAIAFSASENTPATCGVSNGVAVATAATGGNGGFNYIWSSGAIGLTASTLSAATYTVTATDSKNCTATTTVTISNLSGPTALPTVNSAVTCGGGNNGNATVTISNGSGNYSYSWSAGTTSQTGTANTNTITLSNLIAGNYTITVFDQSNSCSTSSTFQITQPAPITLTATNNQIACWLNANTSLCNATAIATATNGTGAYSYNWSNGQTGATATNLCSVANVGYTVTVTDGNSCTATSITLIAASSIYLNTSKTDISCNGLNNGIATANLIAAGPYTVNWSNASVTETISTLSPATYTVTVTDVNNCVITSTALISEPLAISFSAAENTAAGCGVSNGVAVATTATGGNGGFNYTWSSGAIGLTASTLAVGTYTVTVVDINSCTATATATINNSGGASITNLTATNSLCNGDNGSATVTIAGGTGPYTYSWSNGVTNTTTAINSASGSVPAGTYTVNITDANNCQISSTVNIVEPISIVASAVQNTAATCGLSNGIATASATGGNNSAYNYVWNNGDVGITASNLAAGTYSVTVTDGSSCTKTTTVNISNSPAPTINNLTPTHPLCNGGTGVAIVNASGNGTLSYVWSNGNTGTTASNLSVGLHNVTVTDGNGCKAIQSVIITEPPAMVFGTPVVTGATCNQSNGSVSFNISGGTGLYTYSWSGGTTGITTSTTLAITNQSSGSYTINVTDANGCTITSNAAVGSSNGVTVAGDAITNVACNGGNGSIAVILSGGATPYTYSWSNSATGVTSGSSVVLNNVVADSYSVTITDGNNCTAVTSFTITEPAIIVVTPLAITDATCNQNNGSIVLATPVGGTPIAIGAYTYSWSNGASTQNVNLLAAGNYTVTIQDNNGCTLVGNGSVGSVVSTVNASATASNNAISEGETVLLSGSGGVTYEWTPAGSLSCANCPVTIANPIVTTTYTLVVTDNFGCMDTTDVKISVNKGCTAEEDIFIANLFSPNNDGKNDVLFVNGDGLTNIYWSIYDRWGNLVFETRNQAEGWDGTVKGNVANTGTYVYYLKGTCKKTNQEVLLKGNVSVLK